MLDTAISLGHGCWYCGGKEGDDLAFSIEFDTPVHLSCLHGAVERNKHDEEAQIMAGELSE
ncbi:hypothetical protein ACFTXL_01140 [Bacillus subtilis]